MKNLIGVTDGQITLELFNITKLSTEQGLNIAKGSGWNYTQMHLPSM